MSGNVPERRDWFMTAARVGATVGRCCFRNEVGHVSSEEDFAVIGDRCVGHL